MPQGETGMKITIEHLTKQYGDFTIERFLYYPFAGDSAAGASPLACAVTLILSVCAFGGSWQATKKILERKDL